MEDHLKTQLLTYKLTVQSAHECTRVQMTFRSKSELLLGFEAKGRRAGSQAGCPYGSSGSQGRAEMIGKYIGSSAESLDKYIIGWLMRDTFVVWSSFTQFTATAPSSAPYLCLFVSVTEFALLSSQSTSHHLDHYELFNERLTPRHQIEHRGCQLAQRIEYANL